MMEKKTRWQAYRNQFLREAHEIKVGLSCLQIPILSIVLKGMFTWYWKNRINKFPRTMHERHGAELKNLVNVNVILMMSKFVSSNLEGRINPFPTIFIKSAESQGARVSFIEMDDATYGNTQKKQKTFGSQVLSALDSSKRNIIVFDANHTPINEELEFCLNDLEELRQRSTIVGCIYDYYLGQPDRVSYWIEKCDKIVILTPCIGPMLKKWMDNPKVLIFPFTPSVFDHIFPNQEPRKILFFYDGSAARHRDIFLSSVESKMSKVEIHFHGNEESNSMSHAQYLKKMNESLLTFTNGFTVSGEHMVTDRIRESLMMGCLPICEDSKSIRYFMKRFQHYFPVKNRYQLLLAVQFFEKYPLLAHKIVERGRHHIERNYGSEAFWKSMIAQHI